VSASILKESSMSRVFLVPLAAVSLLPAVASADVAPEPTCGVRLVRATEALRAEVGAALAADAAACQGDLDVWLIPSDGGVYVQARDRLGRIRERVVADGTTAATLIASWVDVDALDAPQDRSHDAAPIDVVAMAPTASARFRPRVEAPGTIEATAPRPVARRGGLSVSAFAVYYRTDDFRGGGVRVAIERPFGRWRIGGVATALQVDTEYWPARTSGDVGVTVARPWRVGGVELIPAAAMAGGVDHSRAASVPIGGPLNTSVYATYARVEGSLTASVPIVGRWSLDAGVASSVAWQPHGYEPAFVALAGPRRR
jgi:hypothetical protein